MLWVSDNAIAGWLDEGPTHRGASLVYNDTAMETVLIIRKGYLLPNQGAEGFVCSLIQRRGIPLPLPRLHYALWAGQDGEGSPSPTSSGLLHWVQDRSGLKVFYGEGEGKVRQHGFPQRRTWRPIHLAVDSESGGIQAVELTEAPVHDAQAVRPMGEEIERHLANAAGDGRDDCGEGYQAPPRSPARWFRWPLKTLFGASLSARWRKPTIRGMTALSCPR